MSYIIDTHCDTLGLLSKNNFLSGGKDMNLSLERLIRGDVKLQCFAVCAQCFADGIELINEFDKLIGYTETLMQVKSKDDIDAVLNSPKIGAMLTVEGGSILDGNEDNLDILYDRGVRTFSLTWNDSNCLCGGIGENIGGVTRFGEKIITRCEEKGIILDISHISEKGFYDVAQYASKPFIASHSNARRICGHKRNLSDDQLLIIKERRGCVSVNFYPPFLCESGTADIGDIIRHIEYIAAYIGVEFVALGSDFDGVENNLPTGMEHPGKLQDICESLARLNYTQTQIDLVCHGNVLRIFNDIIPRR